MPILSRPKGTSTSNCRTIGKTGDIQKIYNSRQWKLLRKAYFMEHPICELCYQEGKINPTAEIHHIKPISTGTDLYQMMDIAFDPHNLMALCEVHHQEIHNKKPKKPLKI